MRKILKPADIRNPVAKPEGGRLEAEGEQVVMSIYWHRRLADGSVVEIAPPAEPVAPIEVNQPARRRRSK